VVMRISVGKLIAANHGFGLAVGRAAGPHGPRDDSATVALFG
jgi:hypothetical protein